LTHRAHSLTLFFEEHSHGEAGGPRNMATSRGGGADRVDRVDRVDPALGSTRVRVDRQRELASIQRELALISH
jgi:hypothetical protein